MFLQDGSKGGVVFGLHVVLEIIEGLPLLEDGEDILPGWCAEVLGELVHDASLLFLADGYGVFDSNFERRRDSFRQGDDGDNKDLHR